jgi:hypothetical protein
MHDIYDVARRGVFAQSNSNVSYNGQTNSCTGGSQCNTALIPKHLVTLFNVAIVAFCEEVS